MSHSVLANERPIVVAIPVHNEAEYIERCLIALAEQRGFDTFEVVAFLNNCTDATSQIVNCLSSRLPYTLHIREQWLEGSHANAGVARRLATQYAQMLAGTEGVILTTDADSRVANDWIATNMAEIDAGSDAVAGMALMDEHDAVTIPAHLIEDEAKSETYATLLDEIDWLLDPDASDPWPRHTQHSGASIAVRAGCLARAGGVPAIALGEDRELFTQLRRVDARIRHSREVIVTVSGRTVGRAKGGMADTIARRMLRPDQWLDDCLEPAAEHARRAMLRALARGVWSGSPGQAASLARALHLPVAKLRSALNSDTFGRVWSDLDRLIPRLGVRVRDVETETMSALAIIDAIRRGDECASKYRAGIGHSAYGVQRAEFRASA